VAARPAAGGAAPAGVIPLEHILGVIDVVGMVAFAVSGALAAARKRMHIAGLILPDAVTGPSASSSPTPPAAPVRYGFLAMA